MIVTSQLSLFSPYVLFCPKNNPFTLPQDSQIYLKCTIHLSLFFIVLIRQILLTVLNNCGFGCCLHGAPTPLLPLFNVLQLQFCCSLPLEACHLKTIHKQIRSQWQINLDPMNKCGIWITPFHPSSHHHPHPMAFPIEWFLHTACSVACLSSCHTKALWSQLIPMTRSSTEMVLHNPLSSAFYQGNDSMLKLGFKKLKVEWF